MTQDEARETIIARSIVASHQGVLVSGIIKAVLDDVPLLMQAIGADRQVYQSWSSDTWFEIWSMPVREVSGE